MNVVSSVLLLLIFALGLLATVVEVLKEGLEARTPTRPAHEPVVAPVLRKSAARPWTPVEAPEPAAVTPAPGEVARMDEPTDEQPAGSEASAETTPEALLEAGRARMADGLAYEAVPLLTRALQAIAARDHWDAPTTMAAGLVLAEAHFADGDRAQARAVASRVVVDALTAGQGAFMADGHTLLGRLAEAGGNHDEALRHFEQALASGPTPERAVEIEARELLVAAARSTASREALAEARAAVVESLGDDHSLTAQLDKALLAVDGGDTPSI